MSRSLPLFICSVFCLIEFLVDVLKVGFVLLVCHWAEVTIKRRSVEHKVTEARRSETRRSNQTQIWSLLHSCDAQTSQTECLRVNATYRILFILNLSIIFKFTDSFTVSFWQSNVSTSTVQSSIYNQDISRKTFKKFDSETVWVWNLQFRQWTAGGAFEERNNNNGGKFRRNAGTLR